MKNPKLLGGLFCAVIVAVLWAILGFGLERAYRFTDPITVSWFRFTVAFLCLGPVMIRRQLLRGHPVTSFFKIPRIMILASAGLALNYVAYAMGVQLTNQGNSQVLSQLGPLVVFLASIFIFKERLRMQQAVGVLLALVGFSLFYHEQLLILSQKLMDFYRGNAWLLCGCLSWAFWAVCQKKSILRGFTAMNLNVVIYLLCSVYLFSFTNLRSLEHLGLYDWILMLALAANTIFAYGLFGLALEWAPSSLIQLIILCNPVITLYLSREPITPRLAFSTALVLCGVGLAVISIPRLRFLRMRRTPEVVRS